MTGQNTRDVWRRREALYWMGSAAVNALAGRSFAAPAFAADAKPIRGVMPIVVTPYTPTGEIDWEDLAQQMVFYDHCGLQGAVWPQGSSDVDLMNKDERMKGMAIIANSCRPLKLASILGVQGATTAEMLEYARYAETLAPDALIAMPPSAEQSMEAYHAYFTALAGVTRRPVIIQTDIPSMSNALAPSTDLLFQLAREHPNLAYVKEEARPLVARMRAEVNEGPLMKGVFGASGGNGWLFELRLGLNGEATAQGAYADVMEKIWQFYQAGKHAEAADAFDKLLLMKNCEAQIPGTQRFIFKKRGVFKSTAARLSGGRVFIPDFKTDEIAEIEMRFATLKPLLVEGA
jgi:dihydrodipicolinate synthase/N-acetylneuraminate lyase